jgi:signal transduction histidine kinase
LLNLVLNAAQAGGGETAVRIETDRVDGLVRLRVADDGPGVPPERVASLFEPFATTKVGGSGLGLAVARRILERHGGTLVYAPEGRGACFEARLPPGPEEVS